jgi:hypothetical protein
MSFISGNAGVPSGERGSVAAQTGTPRIILMDGATDRFWVEIGFRARYREDVGSPPLADVIHGRISALYRLENVDPACPGWAEIADDYVWLRVVRSSVTFDGSVYGDADTLRLLDSEHQERVQRRISSHLATLLAGHFQPKPHRIGSQFRRLITRTTTGSSGVAIPLELDGATPADGALSSIRRVFLEGHDFAVAVSSDHIIAGLQSQIDASLGLQYGFHYTQDAGIGGGVELDYHVRIDATDAEWLGATALNLPGGLIRISVRGPGWATRLYRSGVFNLGSVDIADLNSTLSIDQLLMLQFDMTGERLWLSALAEPNITMDYNGPFATGVKSLARESISREFKTLLATHLNQAQSELDKLGAGGKKANLIEQLRTIDAAANASFVDAAYPIEGVVLRGSIQLSHRHAPRATFEKGDAGQYFDAIESWIPGGRVDSFEWSWRWFADPVHAAPGTTGSRSEADTFLLRRPHGGRNRYGLNRASKSHCRDSTDPARSV